MNHHFNTDVAKKYGLEEAILLENLYFWVKKNKANNQNYHDGYYWTYNSVKAFNELFDYITPSKISRVLKNLETNGLVKTGCYNTNKYDHTKWYTVTEKVKAFFENDVSILQNEESTFEKTEITITDINTDDKTKMINTDKEADSNELPTVKKTYPPESLELAETLLSECKKVDSHFNRTEKQLESWAADFDKLNRIDCREWDDIKRVLLWAKSDSFWNANILSASNFREKYPTLVAQMQRGMNGKPFMSNDVYTGEDW